jgi:predicted glutamine amidotransferase
MRSGRESRDLAGACIRFFALFEVPTETGPQADGSGAAAAKCFMRVQQLLHSAAENRLPLRCVALPTELLATAICSSSSAQTRAARVLRLFLCRRLELFEDDGVTPHVPMDCVPRRDHHARSVRDRCVASLVAQSVRALEATARVNGDGFGLGWYGDYPEPGLYREIRPAWSDENLRYLCRHLRSHLFFAHVRAATGTPITRVNCHPFASGVWLFMHNGFVGGWNRVRRRVEAMIPDALYPSRIGTTDSEALFLAIMGQGGARDPMGAEESVLQSITAMASESPSPDSLRFTAALTNGRDFAFRYAAHDATNTLYFAKAHRRCWSSPSRSTASANAGPRCPRGMRLWRARASAPASCRSRSG